MLLMLIHYDTLLHTTIHIDTNQAFVFDRIKNSRKLDIHLTDRMEFLICDSEKAKYPGDMSNTNLN